MALTAGTATTDAIVGLVVGLELVVKVSQLAGILGIGIAKTKGGQTSC